MNFNGSLKHSKFESLKLVYMGDIDHWDWSHNSNRLENIISAIGNESVVSILFSLLNSLSDYDLIYQKINFYRVL